MTHQKVRWGEIKDPVDIQQSEQIIRPVPDYLPPQKQGRSIMQHSISSIRQKNVKEKSVSRKFARELGIEMFNVEAFDSKLRIVES